MGQAEERKAKGTNLIDLVKWLRAENKVGPATPLSALARTIVETRVLPTAWYPHRAFLELLDVAYKELLGRSERKAYELGLLGGRKQLEGFHKAFISIGDPRGSVLAMRHTWRAYFNFGNLRADAEQDSVLFELTGYDDVQPPHAQMIVAWAAAAAHLAGADKAHGKVVDKPWEGATCLRYRVTF